MAPYRTELTNIESSGKSPEAAWNDALSQARQIAQRQGVS
jgi:cellobiose transport system substrate-binding protein